ncbi:hypothetical protein [Spirillospora sp. NPDC047279]|uniref:hypothetical protein n=1 Tax=Spirillospora sp. NPDC047279 TaxID=3155478 RepID=UPI0033DE7B98
MFGDGRFADRTSGSELFINPLMALYFSVDLDGLARHNPYLDRIEDTRQIRQIATIIEDFRDGVTTCRPRRFPH